MKELIIRVVIDQDKVATAVQKKGFENQSSASTAFEVVGILENLKKIEQDKLDAKSATLSRMEE
jgi:hypothetical protein